MMKYDMNSSSGLHIVDGMLWQYTGLGSSVVVPARVSEIAGATFMDLDEIRYVKLPEGLVSIGKRCFEGCTQLESISLPDSLRSIGDYAFADCKALKNFKLPQSLTAVGASVFKNCSSVTRITVPENVTSIGLNAFSGCTGLESIFIPAGVTDFRVVFNQHPFMGCSRLTIYTPAGSEAERFAVKYNIPCISAESAPADAGSEDLLIAENSIMYERATELFNERTEDSILEAIDIMTTISPFMDSLKRIEEFRKALETEQQYSRAVIYMNSGDRRGVDHARHLFNTLSGYKDSEARYHRCVRMLTGEDPMLFETAGGRSDEGTGSDTRPAAVMTEIPAQADIPTDTTAEEQPVTEGPDTSSDTSGASSAYREAIPEPYAAPDRSETEKVRADEDAPSKPEDVKLSGDGSSAKQAYDEYIKEHIRKAEAEAAAASEASVKHSDKSAAAEAGGSAAGAAESDTDVEKKNTERKKKRGLFGFLKKKSASDIPAPPSGEAREAAKAGAEEPELKAAGIRADSSAAASDIRGADKAADIRGHDSGVASDVRTKAGTAGINAHSSAAAPDIKSEAGTAGISAGGTGAASDLKGRDKTAGLRDTAAASGIKPSAQAKATDNILSIDAENADGAAPPKKGRAGRIILIILIIAILGAAGFAAYRMLGPGKTGSGGGSEGGSEAQVPPSEGDGYELNLEDFVNYNPDARAQIDQSVDGTDVTVSISKNTLTYTYDLSDSDGITQETARSDEVRDALSNTLDSSSSRLTELCSSLENDTGISGIIVRVEYKYGEDTLLSQEFTADGQAEGSEADSGQKQ